MNIHLHRDLTRMRGGKVGEIRIFLALEYPELEKIVSLLKEEPYQKGSNLFFQDIGLFCGEKIYRSFCFSVESDMEYMGRLPLLCSDREQKDSFYLGFIIIYKSVFLMR